LAFGEKKSEKEAGKPEEKKSEKKKPPVDRVKVGGISVSVWENKAKSGGEFHTFSLQRTYKDGDEFKYTGLLRASDLPKAVLALQKTYEKAMDVE